MIRFTLLVIISIFSLSSYSQNLGLNDAPNIFIDCQTWCHRTFIRQQMTYVNHMQDRQNADVFIQITSEDLSAGGDQYRIFLTGKGRFEGMEDMVKYEVDGNTAEGELREKMLKYITQGLMPYLLKTSIAKKITFDIDYNPGVIEEVIEDPWKAWVFRVSSNINISGQESFQDLSLRSRISASKVTEDIKIEPRLYYNYQRNSFSFDDEPDEIFVVTNTGADLKIVKSISDHFSVGFFSSLEESTFSNYNLSGSFQPAVEYNFFPYNETSKKRFSFLYRIGPQYNDYVDTTIYDIEKELLYRHSLELDFKKIEDWGSLEFEFVTGNYLHDWNLFFASINPYAEVNIVKGLSFYFGCSISWTRNLINIPKGDASREDVLLQLVQLQSNYNYYGWFGISYRFGSKYNNVVNSRF